MRFSDSPPRGKVTLGPGNVGGRGSSTRPEPKLCRRFGADPPADVDGNEPGAPEDGSRLEDVDIDSDSEASMLLFTAGSVSSATNIMCMRIAVIHCIKSCMQCFCDSSLLLVYNTIKI